MQISINQVDPAGLTLFIQNISTTGSSGNVLNYVNSNGYLGPNVVYSSGVDQTIYGNKTFVLNPFVNYSAGTGQVTSKLYIDNSISTFSGYSQSQLLSYSGYNNNYISGISGVLVSATTTAITNVVYATGDQLISGNKTFINSPLVPDPIIGSGTVNLNTLSGTSGSIISYVNFISGLIPSNFVNNFFFNQNNLITGLNLAEFFVPNYFYFTGYALGVINSGTSGYFSGSLYQRDQTNNKTNFVDFSLNSGLYFYTSGGFSQYITGMNRVGIDIYQTGVAMNGLSVGIFGNLY